MKRIHIMGCAASGKTTLAKLLSTKLKCKLIHLDDIFWKRKYDKKRDLKECKKLMKEKIKNKKWIVEGIYTNWVEDSLKKADLIIFLDVHLGVVSYRILKRYFSRKLNGSKVKETLKDNLRIIKLMHNWRRRPEEHPKSYRKALKPHLNKVVFLRNRKEVKKFLERL
ncbi:AAA family ATPase [Candidatus Woesearchaeota archaeon]|nr:AAA family ATPase [Candidatus Woesearchaeota archaeon]